MRFLCGAAPFVAVSAVLAAPVAPASSPSKPAAGAVTAPGTTAGSPLNATAPSPAFGASALGNPNIYLLGPADVLSVVVEGQPQYSHAEVPVAPDGKIVLPFYGTFMVKGQTVKQVQTLLLGKLHQRMRRPQLTVSLLRPRPLEYYVINILGNAVRAPGVVQIQPNYRLTEAIAKAGGLVGRPEDTVATLTRGKAAPRSLDLVTALETPSSPANVKVAPNDVLSLSLVEPKRLTIDGDVARPGVYLLRRYPAPGASELPLEPRLRDAIIAAGNVRSPFPRQSTEVGVGVAPPPPRFTGYILRGRDRIPLDIEALSDFSDRNANVQLQANDYVRIEVAPPTRVVIQGLVKQSGDLALPPGSSVIDAIAAAGGLTEVADKVVVTISRSGKVLPVDVNKALLQNDPESNLKLQNGDNILVSAPLTMQITLSGEFLRPAIVKLPPGTTLLDAIAGAGGLKVDPADARLNLLRQMPGGKQAVLSIDTVALFRQNDLSQNVRLQEGDVVNVASVRRATVYINGEVANAGVHQLGEKEGLLEALAKAGGPTPRAALTQVLVKREGATQAVDVYSALKEGTPLEFPLQDGDYIIVQPIKQRVMVMGAVRKPDYYPLPEKGDLTALAAITLAGGAVDGARTRQIAVMRPGQSGVETNVLSFREIQKGNWSGNATLTDGDVVYVPERDLTPTTIGKIRNSVGALLLVPRLLNGF